VIEWIVDDEDWGLEGMKIIQTLISN